MVQASENSTRENWWELVNWGKREETTPEYPKGPVSKYFYFIIMSIITIGIIGNFVLMIITKLITAGKLYYFQVLMVHLFVADIIFTTCTIFPKLAPVVYYKNFFLTKLIYFLRAVSLFTEANLMVVISIDCYFVVFKERNAFWFKYRLYHLLAFIAWGVSVFETSLQWSVSICEKVSYGTFIFCYCDIENIWWYKVIAFFVAVFHWILPLVVVLLLYSLICIKLRRIIKNALTPLNVFETHPSDNTVREREDNDETLSSEIAFDNRINFHTVSSIQFTIRLLMNYFMFMGPLYYIDLLFAFSFGT